MKSPLKPRPAYVKDTGYGRASFSSKLSACPAGTNVPNPCAHEFGLDDCGIPFGVLGDEDAVLRYENYGSGESYLRPGEQCRHGAQDVRLCDYQSLLVHADEGATGSSPFVHTESPVLLEGKRWMRIGPVREWVEGALHEIECALFDPDNGRDLTRVKETCKTLFFVTNTTRFEFPTTGSGTDLVDLHKFTFYS